MKKMIRLLFMCGIAACSTVLVASGCNCEEGCTRNLTESCTDGWYGPCCQKKNVALYGIANQQGTWEELGAGLAVDGNFTTQHGLRICAHTDSRNHSWWNMQLGDNGVNQIRYMKIYSRAEAKQICKDGRYGQNCVSVCGHCANNVSCEKTTGHCASGCETGWEDDRCDRDSSLKWPILPMVISAVGTSIAVLIVVAGVCLCLHRQERLLCVRQSARQPDDAVKMSDVTNQPEHLYDTLH